jgi:osmotically-inducible protein OsmY
VTLRGFVENDAQRQEVLGIARNTDGVTGIDDQLLIGRAPRDGFEPAVGDTVATTGAAGVPDAPAGADVDRDGMIVNRIQSRYFLDPQIKRRHIDVQVADGVVTLRGQVAGDSERAQALLLARTAEGVTRVEDGLTVDASLGEAATPLGASGNPAVQPAPAPAAPVPTTPAPRSNAAPPPNAAPAPDATVSIPGATSSGDRGAAGAAPGNARGGSAAGPAAGSSTADTALESRVKAAVSADAQLKGANVEVSARDGVVLLQGSVANQAAKQRLLTAVRNAEGVTQVVDRVAVGARR